MTYQYLISIPAEIVAAAVIVQFWVDVNNAVWITVFSAILFASNVFLVRIYGEVEFTFAILKILLVVGMNIMVWLLSSVVIDLPTSDIYRVWSSPREAAPITRPLGSSTGIIPAHSSSTSELAAH